MKIRAGGQNRFHGWNDIISTDLTTLDWKGPGGQTNQIITWSDVEIHLNGDYKVEVTFTGNDLKALAPRLLTKKEMITLAGLTDEETINMARKSLAKLSNGDKPNVKVLFGMVEAMLTRKEVISLLNLTDKEKINLARETLQDMPFGQVAAMIHEESEQETV
jgi:ATP-dependent Lon protease